jgi:hypothetical protein
MEGPTTTSCAIKTAMKLHHHELHEQVDRDAVEYAGL